MTGPRLQERERPRRVWLAMPAPPVASGAESSGATSRAGGNSPMESVARGALSLLSAQPLTWATTLLAIVLLPRLLGARVLGEYSVLISLGTLAGAAASLGLPTILTRSVAAGGAESDELLSRSLVLQTIVAGAAAAAVTFLGPILHIPFPRPAIALAMAVMVVTNTVTLLTAVLMGRERHSLYAWFNAGLSVLTTLACLGIVLLGGGVNALFACMAAAAALVAATAWPICHVRLRPSSFSPRALFQLAAEGLPLVGWNLALQVYGQIDGILLAVLAPTAVVGWYAAAYRIISVPVFIPTLITTPLLPALSRCTRDFEAFAATLRRSAVGVLLLTTPIAALIFALAPSIPWLLHWGNEFDRSVPLMMILILSEPIVALDMVLATGIMALKQERAWLVVGIAASVFNPAANLVLIPICERLLQNGAIAASIITVTTELIMLAGALVILPASTIDSRTASLCGRVLLAGALAALAGAWLRPICLPLAPIACGSLFATLALALGTVTPSELRALSRMPVQLLTRRSAPARG